MIPEKKTVEEKKKATILEIDNLHKSYGKFQALQGINLEIYAGEMFGLLGPNGAGKTTLLSIICGLLPASAGEVRFLGKKLFSQFKEYRHQLGIVTQDLAIYPELSATENLRFFGRLYELSGPILEERIKETLSWVGLSETKQQRAGTFSGGMKRRLNLGIAVIHKPKLLLLDEPTTGVDPQSRNHIFERVKELNQQGMTIIYTSHYMEEVQELCTRIGILDRGKLIACDYLPSLLQLLEGSVQFELASDINRVVQRLLTIPELRVTGVDRQTISLSGPDISAVMIQSIRVFREMNVDLHQLRIREPNLERVFLHLTDRTLRD